MFTENRKSIYAHRRAWEIYNGPIPNGMCVCHKCDNPPCCNPEHLFLGSHKDNIRDALRKGRLGPQVETLRKLWNEKGHLQRGESNPKHKLTTEKVIEMRRLHAEGFGYKRLSKLFSVSFGVTQRIVNRKAWKHVP